MDFTNVIYQVEQPPPSQVHLAKSFIKHRKVRWVEYVLGEVTSLREEKLVEVKIRRHHTFGQFWTRDLEYYLPKKDEKHLYFERLSKRAQSNENPITCVSFVSVFVH